MKRALSLALALCLLLLLAACGGSSGGSDSMSAPSDASYNTAASDNSGWSEEAPSESGGGIYGDELSATGSALANAKVINTADLDLETKEFDSASQALDRIVESLGGYYESRSLNQGGSYRSLSCTVRVPADSFSAFLDQMGEAAHVTSRHEYTDDVSEAYYDNEARLTTQRTKLERLQKLLAEADTMEDIIQLESAISDTELQIEYLSGTLRKYDSLIGYSTINLYLREVYRLSSDEEPATTFGQRLNAALSAGLERGIEGLEDLTIGIARNWMAILFLAVVVAVALVLLRRRRRRRRTPPPPPSVPSKEDSAPNS